MDPITPIATVATNTAILVPAAPGSVMPEIPGGFDLLAAGACLVVAELAKTWADTQKDPARAEQVRRLLPFVLLFVGAAVRTGLEMTDGGADPKTALMRGGVAGAMAVYAHSAGKGATGSSSFLTDAVQLILAAIGLKKKTPADLETPPAPAPVAPPAAPETPALAEAPTGTPATSTTTAVPDDEKTPT